MGEKPSYCYDMDYLFSFILLHLSGMGLLDVINDVWIGDTTRITVTFYTTTTTTTAALYIHIGQSSTIFHNSCKQGFVFSFLATIPHKLKVE